jgi:hypothetical protein
LADGARPARDVIDDASDIGFSKRTVERAFRAIDGQSQRKGFGAPVVWSLPILATNHANGPRYKQPGENETTWRDCMNPEEEEENTKFLSPEQTYTPSSVCVDPFAERNGFSNQDDVPF